MDDQRPAPELVAPPGPGAAINRGRVTAGVRLFLALSIAGMTILFFLSGKGEPWKLIPGLRPGWLAVCLALVAVDLVAGAARIHIFLRRSNPGSSGACFRANLANIFLAAATPFQTGGGPAQLYVLHRHGVPYARGVAVSILNFVATLLLLALIGTVIWATLPRGLFGNGPLALILDVSRIAFYAVLALFLLFLLSPAGFGRTADGLLQRIGRRSMRQRGRIERWRLRILAFTRDYAAHMAEYRREERAALIWNVILTIVLYFNKCLVAWAVIRAMGLDADFWLVVRLQLLIIFFLYFAPTPGASLVAEVGIYSVMIAALPREALFAFTILWRFFTTYFGVLLGSLVLLRIMAHPLVSGSSVERPRALRAG